MGNISILQFNKVRFQKTVILCFLDKRFSATSNYIIYFRKFNKKYGFWNALNSTKMLSVSIVCRLSMSFQIFILSKKLVCWFCRKGCQLNLSAFTNIQNKLSQSIRFWTNSWFKISTSKLVDLNSFTNLHKRISVNLSLNCIVDQSTVSENWTWCKRYSNRFH